VLDDDVMVPMPQVGRTFSVSRPVRLGDAAPGGRLRFDALARMLQDVATDDARSCLTNAMSWLVRRLAIEVHQPAVFDEMLTLTTFCGGIGSRWAQRRTSIVGDRGAHIEVAGLWVCVDMTTYRPVVLAPEFTEIYGSAAAGRTVRARLHHDDPPASAERVPYAPRFVDFDVMHHLNNASYWNAVEEGIGQRPALRGPVRAEMEFRQSIERTDSPSTVLVSDNTNLALWYVEAERIFASVAIRPLLVPSGAS
jgi:acyl-ACP thioesterase